MEPDEHPEFLAALEILPNGLFQVVDCDGGIIVRDHSLPEIMGKVNTLLLSARARHNQQKFDRYRAEQRRNRPQ